MEVVASLSQGRTAAAQCGLFTYKSVPVIFEPPCNCELYTVTERYLTPVFQNMPVAVSPVVPMSVVQQFNRFDDAVKLDGRSNISPQFYRIPSLNKSSRS